MAGSIMLGLQLQVQIGVYLSNFLCSSAKADGYDPYAKCPRLQQPATERQLNKFRPLYLIITFLPFSLLLLRLSLLKAHFEIRIINYMPLHMSKIWNPITDDEAMIFQSNSADWLLKISSLCHLMSFTCFETVCDVFDVFPTLTSL